MPLTKVKLKIKPEEVPHHKLGIASEGEIISMKPPIQPPPPSVEGERGAEEVELISAARPAPSSAGAAKSVATTGLQPEAMEAQAEAVQPEAEPVGTPAQ
ncbi:MAG: hypothetical protein QXI45_00670, partial [Thermofilaceae archaeon]